MVKTVMASGIRLATQEDLPAIGRLLSLRDGRDWTLTQLQWFLSGLEPDRCVGWIANDEDECVAFSNVFLRTLECQGKRWPAAYWANLYVDERHRQSMWYPRLVLAMFSWIREGHVDFLYACVRLPHVVEGHLRLGFQKVGDIPLLILPVRPFRLLLRKSILPEFIEPICGPFDTFARWVSRRGRWTGQACELTSGNLRNITDKLAQQAATNPELITQSPDMERAYERYQQTREGESYFLFTFENAAAIARIAHRERVVATVLMDYAANDERQLKALLRRVRIFAEEQDADVIIALDGGPNPPLGFLRQGEYQLLVWAPRPADLDAPIFDLSRWRFCFADHDAF